MQSIDWLFCRIWPDSFTRIFIGRGRFYIRTLTILCSYPLLCQSRCGFSGSRDYANMTCRPPGRRCSRISPSGRCCAKSSARFITILVSLIRAMSCFSPPVVSLPAPGGTARLHNLVQLELKPIQTLLQNYPYTQFPVVINGQISGVLTREEATRAIREKRPPALAEATICPPDLSLRQVETQLIESRTGCFCSRKNLMAR